MSDQVERQREGQIRAVAADGSKAQRGSGAIEQPRRCVSLETTEGGGSTFACTKRGRSTIKGNE
jgi:hypothetical protein